jgi:hypothetical protein
MKKTKGYIILNKSKLLVKINNKNVTIDELSYFKDKFEEFLKHETHKILIVPHDVEIYQKIKGKWVELKGVEESWLKSYKATVEKN